MAGNVAAGRKYKYGITAAEYTALLERQDGKCAGCGNGEVMLGRGGSVRSLGVDHCHATGVIRGLLCDKCNNILGRAKDSPALLRRLAAYVEVADTGYKVKSLSLANKHSRNTLPADAPLAIVDADAILNELIEGVPSWRAE